MVTLQCLLLLIIANGAPVAAWKLLRQRFDCPVDAGLKFLDGRPLFGPSKTIRGILASVGATSVAAVLMDLSFATGALIGVCAMLGDLLSSFIKRRLNIGPSGMAIGLDQVPESLLPLLAVRSQLALTWMQILALLAAFLMIDLLLSRVLFALHLRKRPY